MEWPSKGKGDLLPRVDNTCTHIALSKEDTRGADLWKGGRRAGKVDRGVIRTKVSEARERKVAALYVLTIRVYIPRALIKNNNAALL